VSAEPVQPGQPGAPGDVPRRATGEIPLSWAMPAEVVTSAVAVPKAPVSLVVVAGVVLCVAIAGFFISQLMSPEPLFAERSVPPAPPSSSTTPTSVPAVAVPAPPLPVEAAPSMPAVQPVAVAEAPTTSAADRAKAKQLVGKARRLAKDGDLDEARDVAEKAVIADPACAECWKTVALLRKKAGDRSGATLAKARADALSGDDSVDP